MGTNVTSVSIENARATVPLTSFSASLFGALTSLVEAVHFASCLVAPVILWLPLGLFVKASTRSSHSSLFRRTSSGRIPVRLLPSDPLRVRGRSEEEMT
ncbi:hypothetical protein M8818_000928 [Zalaria obscura]|uniref:Uncharacterized protein n=1 Tax=Zalaria obscura TaxID=2024903 RepID=A0ACC3SN82_9PEZI